MNIRAWILAATCAVSALPGIAMAQGLAGPYLSATQADVRNDYDAAAEFYAKALIRDPEDRNLLHAALIAHVASDKMDMAETIAARLLEIEPKHQIAALVKLAIAAKEEAFGTVEAIANDDEFRLNPLFSGLLDGWSAVGSGDYEQAIARFDALDENETLLVYGQYHKALALALAGDFLAAAELMEGDEKGPLHVNRAAVIAHVAMLSQAGEAGRALGVIEGALAEGFADPELSRLYEALSNGETVPFTTVASASDGAARAFGLLASALARDEADRFSLVYARLATLISPNLDEIRLLAAETLSLQSQYDMAIETFERMSPDSPFYTNAEIGRAEALRDDDQNDRAIEVLSNLSRERPGDFSILNALGDLQRLNEDFEDAASTYSRAIGLIAEENSSHWVVYYSRGIAFERSDQWSKAESDFRKALELQPDQPLVLNYLGYSLVELRRNFDEAQEMIEKAVEQRPNDGYITDSLGWVLYRIGKFEEAVPHMERAVELLPIDPIINDHLGDVLYKVGRKLEAEFQWRRALSFEPEEKEAERIRLKLELGLDAVLKMEASSEGDTGETAQDG